MASHADWVNLSGAENARNIIEIYVEKDRVRILMEIFVDDLKIFAELIPADLFSKPISGRPGLAKRQQIFADRVLQIVTDRWHSAASNHDLGALLGAVTESDRTHDRPGRAFPLRHDGALDLRAQWTALGQVGHWGHIHSRQNRYDAIVTIKPVAGAWKIIDLELLEEKRLF